MVQLTALFDANVFFGMTMTDIVMETARAGLYRARWTDQIHDEWVENLLRKQPGRTRDALMRRRRAMDIAVRDALVTGYEPTIGTFMLPDPNDRHVLAAAVTARADLIVTSNLDDFPAATLAAFNIAAIHPDNFLTEQFDADEAAFLGCIKRCRERLKNSPVTSDGYLARITKAGLPLLSARLQAYKTVI